MHIDEYRAAWNGPKQREKVPRSDLQPQPALTDGRRAADAAEPHTAASGKTVPEPVRSCPHHAIRETSIGGILTHRSCIDCDTPLPGRDWEPGEEWPQYQTPCDEAPEGEPCPAD